MFTTDLFEPSKPAIGLEVFNQLMQCIERGTGCDLSIGIEVKNITAQEARYILGQYRTISRDDKEAGLEFLSDIHSIESCLETIDERTQGSDQAHYVNADQYAEPSNYQVRETDRTNMPIGSPKSFATHEEAVEYARECKAANPKHKFAVYRVAFSMTQSGIPEYTGTSEDRTNTEIYSVAIQNTKTGGRRNVEMRVDSGSPEAKALEYLQANETIRSITPKEGVLDSVDESQETELDLHKGVVPSEPLPEGWSERALAQRTGQPQTPYGVYIDGRQWKEFPTEDQARSVARKLEAKFKADGSNKKVSYSPAQSYMKKDMDESVGVTDYNPPSQGGTRKELLAKYAKTGSSKDAEAARRAGASQMELKAAHPGKSIDESAYGPDEKLADVSKIDTQTLQSMHALHKHYGQKNPRNKASAERAAAELLKRGIKVTEGGVDNLEARRIDDLNMKMLELLDRAKEPAYKKNPKALAALKAQFQKVKAERDGYFKINPATGMDPSGLLGTTKGVLDEAYQAQYKTKDQAIAYAKERVKEFRDSLDGVEIWQLPTGFDVVHTMNANGRNHVVANGGKKLGTVYQQKSTVSETTDWKEYERRVAALEKRGLSRSDAQGVVDAEMMQKTVKEDYTPDTNYKYTVVVDGEEHGDYTSAEEAKDTVRKLRTQAPGHNFKIKQRALTSAGSVKRFAKNRDMDEGRDGVFHASNPKIDLYNKRTREYLGSTNFYQTVFTAVQSYVQKHPELEGLVVGKKDVKESTDKKQAHQYNLDAAQREIDRRSAEGEDMSTARINPKTYEIVKESVQKKNNRVPLAHSVGFSNQELTRFSKNAGHDFNKFSKNIAESFHLPRWVNTLELFGTYARRLNENIDSSKMSETESSLFKKFNDDTSNSDVDHAGVGDKVALLNLTTQDIPQHGIHATLYGFTDPKEIKSIGKTIDGQKQYVFTDGEKYPDTDSQIMMLAQSWSSTKLFSSKTLADKASMFYILKGSHRNDKLNFTVNIDSTDNEIQESKPKIILPRNFVAKNMKQSGQGQHRNEKQAQKQGDFKHRRDAIPMDEAAELDHIEENLRNWFKEKWVRFGPDGKIKGDCARGKSSEGKPKCLPQKKAHALGKKGRASAGARKRREDPNANRTGKAKNVATKKKTSENISETTIRVPHGGKMVTGRIVRYDRGNPESPFYIVDIGEYGSIRVPAHKIETLDEACWKGYHKDGMKTMFGKKYPNCVKNKKKNEDVAEGFKYIGDRRKFFALRKKSVQELDSIINSPTSSTNDKELAKRVKAEKQKTGVAEATSKNDLINRLQKDLRKVMDPKNKSTGSVNWTGPGKDDYGYTGYQGHGMPTDRQERDSVKKTDEQQLDEKGKGLWANIRAKQKRIKAGSGERMRKPGSKGSPSNADLKSIRASSNESTEDLDEMQLDEKGKGLWANIRAKQKRIKAGSGERMRKPGSKGSPSDADLKYIRSTSKEDVEEACWDTHKQVGMKTKGGRQVPNCVPRESVTEGIPFNQCPGCGGSIVHESQLTEKKDACYHKVKSRYKVWPSAYASGALVKCRKVGAKNWGNSTKKESIEPVAEEWSQKYKDSINCSNPQGFSQKAHCAGKKKNEDVSESASDSVASQVLQRIIAGHREVLSRHSAEDILDAAREVTMISSTDDIGELTAKTIDTLTHEMNSERDLAEADDKAKLKPGQYFVWTAHFDDGTDSRVKVKAEDFDVKKFYADKGKNVINVDYNWTVHGSEDRSTSAGAGKKLAQVDREVEQSDTDENR